MCFKPKDELHEQIAATDPCDHGMGERVPQERHATENHKTTYNATRHGDDGSAEQLVQALVPVMDKEELYDPENPSRYAMRLTTYRDVILMRGRTDQHQMFASLLAATHQGLHASATSAATPAASPRAKVRPGFGRFGAAPRQKPQEEKDEEAEGSLQ